MHSISLAGWRANSSRRRQEILAARRERAPAWPPARTARFPGRDGVRARIGVAGGEGAGRPRRPPRRDHRPGRAQDDDQRAQLRREGLHGRLRGRAVADVGERRRRAGGAAGRGARARSSFTSPEGKAYSLDDASATLRRPPARLAPGRAARRRSTARRSRRRCSTSACTCFHNARRAARARHRAVLLPAQDASRTSRRGCGTTSSSGRRTRRHPARHDPGDGADRDDLGRVRDGRDPVRAARARRGAQRRPLGLHLQHHQEVLRSGARSSARPGAGDDGGAVHARLRASCWSRRATGAARTRSAA